MKVRLNREWTLLLERYKGDHRDPRNQATHMIGIPMILASLPISASLVGLPLGASMFTVGWGFQFLGHWFEGNDPAFFGDRRNLLVGVLWWAEKTGIWQLELDTGTRKPAADEPTIYA
jgi:uncharacterized membrane protein YGL010W